MFRDEVGRFCVAPTERFNELFVVLRVGSPGIRRVTSQQHSRLSRERFVGARKSLAAR
jgi:hypothetical protein